MISPIPVALSAVEDSFDTSKSRFPDHPGFPPAEYCPLSILKYSKRAWKCTTLSAMNQPEI